MTYTREFGADVAGLVLVDTFHPETKQRNPFGRPFVKGQLRKLQIANALSWTGILRAMVGSADADAAYLPTTIGAMLKEIEALDRSLAEAGASRQLGSRPLFVLTSGKLSDGFLADAGLTAVQGGQFQAVERGLHEEQASWSTHSQYEIVADAAHRIQDERPDRVVNATQWVVDAVRADTAH